MFHVQSKADRKNNKKTLWRIFPHQYLKTSLSQVSSLSNIIKSLKKAMVLIESKQHWLGNEALMEWLLI